MARKASAKSLTIEDTADWLSPRDALALFAGTLDHQDAISMILVRLRMGKIRVLAESVYIPSENEKDDNVLIPAAAWGGDNAPRHGNPFWRTGDIDLWLEQPNSTDSVEYLFQGVRLERIPVVALVPKAAADRPSAPPSTMSPLPVVPNKGGRPALPWWEELWIEMARQLYSGDLQPKKQADIEKAMLDWLATKGYQHSESSVRVAARKLYTAISSDG